MKKKKRSGKELSLTSRILSNAIQNVERSESALTGQALALNARYAGLQSIVSDMDGISEKMVDFHDSLKTIVRKGLKDVMVDLIRAEIKDEMKENYKTLMHLSEAVHGRLSRVQDLLDHRIAQLEAEVMRVK